MRHRSRRSFVVLAIALLGVMIVAGTWKKRQRQGNPDAAFREITGRALPPGVRATAYATEINDGPFRTTHYWLLTGSPVAFRRLTENTGFVESLDDARWSLPDMQRHFGLDLTERDVAVGFEWELDHDRWYCIFAGETTALYSH